LQKSSEAEAKGTNQQPGSGRPALLCLKLKLLSAGRAAISVRRKTGDGERNGSKMDFPVGHCQWGKKRIRGNHGAIRWMSRHAAIHWALGLIVTRGQCGFRLRRGRAMVMMYWAITMVCCHGYSMAWHGFPCSGRRRRHNRRKHGRKQSSHNRDGQESPHITKRTIPLVSPRMQWDSSGWQIKSFTCARPLRSTCDLCLLESPICNRLRATELRRGRNALSHGRDVFPNRNIQPA
jgi:hypothetical protein